MKTNKKLINPKTVGCNIALGFCVLIIVFALAILVSCDNEPKPATCQCPNGTEHLPGQNCCDNSDCTCTKVPGTVASNGLPITNRQNMPQTQFDTIVGLINQALNNQILAPAATGIKKDIKEIKVMNSTGVANITSNILIVYTNSGANAIRSVLEDWAWDEGYLSMLQQFDNSKNTVRMATQSDKHPNCLAYHCT